MAKAIHYSPNMVCPYCGNEEFYIKQSYKGNCYYNMRFDMNNINVDNSTMFDDVSYKNQGQYAYCNNCFKRLFKIEELPAKHW